MASTVPDFLEITYPLVSLHETAQWILQKIGPPGVWQVEGTMGAGKTTLIAAIAEELGSTDTASSPTFGLVHEYALSSGNSLYHMDLYRIQSYEEAYEAGVTELIESGAPCIVEWSSLYPALFKGEYYRLLITFVDSNTRKLLITSHA
jgi:tRNA threonylcarbamoyladenosine biosynthesis protein TsaE